jgi:hypothetical protein
MSVRESFIIKLSLLHKEVPMSMSKLVGSGAPSAAEKRERMRGLPVPQTGFLALRQEGSPPSCTSCFSDTSGTLKKPY